MKLIEVKKIIINIKKKKDSNLSFYEFLVQLFFSNFLEIREECVLIQNCVFEFL